MKRIRRSRAKYQKRVLAGHIRKARPLLQYETLTECKIKVLVGSCERAMCGGLESGEIGRLQWNTGSRVIDNAVNQVRVYSTSIGFGAPQ